MPPLDTAPPADAPNAASGEAPALVLADWPLFGWADDVRPALREAQARGLAAALVTLTDVRESGPRPVGAQMLLAEGVAAGFLSGGCVEGDVAVHAAATIADGRPRRLVYGEGSPWPDIRLLCGSRIELLVERIGPEDPAATRLLALTAARRPATWITDGERRACLAEGEAPPPEVADAEVVRRRYEPATRLVVVGGDPAALAMAQLGAQAQMESTLVRPRGPETPPPLPGVGYRRGPAGRMLAELGLDAWTAVAVAAHDEQLDAEALTAALGSDAFYVGLLGARRRLAGRLERLRAAGIAETQLARLHAPIGLDLGDKSPWGVAVAVLAEVMRERSRARG